MMEVGRSSPCSIASFGYLDNINSSSYAVHCAYRKNLHDYSQYPSTSPTQTIVIPCQNTNGKAEESAQDIIPACSKKERVINRIGSSNSTPPFNCNYSYSHDTDSFNNIYRQQDVNMSVQSSTDILHKALLANAPLDALKFLIDVAYEPTSHRVNLIEDFEKASKKRKHHHHHHHHHHQKRVASSVPPKSINATYDDYDSIMALPTNANNNNIAMNLLNHLISSIILGTSLYAVEALEYLLSRFPEVAATVATTNKNNQQFKNPLVHLLSTTAIGDGSRMRILKATKLVVSACPELVGIQSSLYGSTPIHLALMFHGSSVEIIKTLISSNPQSVTVPSQRGDLLIHTAMAYCVPMETLDTILSATASIAPELLLEATDSRGLSPIQLAWIKHLDPDFEYRLTKIRKLDVYGSLLDEAVQDVINKVSSSSSSLVVTKDYVRRCIKSVFGSFWKRTELYLQYVTQASESNWNIVHAASAANIPRALLKLLLMLHPEQANMVDDRNQLPLHIAASTPKYPWWSTTTYSNSFTKESVADDDNKHPSVIQMLLQLNSPAAANLDSGMQLTLHRAIERKATATSMHDSDVELIVKAYPDALHVKDPKSSLYPFMQAAAARKDASIETIYFLLRQCPHVIYSG